MPYSINRLTLNNTEVDTLEIFEPSSRLVARIFGHISVRKLLHPGFLIGDRTTLISACLTNAKVLVVSPGISILEVSIGASEGGAWIWVDIYADDIDVIGTGPPAIYGLAGCVLVRGPEHEDFRITGNCCVDGLPGSLELRESCRARQLVLSQGKELVRCPLLPPG